MAIKYADASCFVANSKEVASFIELDSGDEIVYQQNETSKTQTSCQRQ